MEPNEYLRALVRRWPIIAIAACIGAAFAFFTTEAEPEPIRNTYSATHTLLVSTDSSSQFGQQAVGTITFAQVPIFATRGEVPSRAAEQLAYDGNPASLASQVTVEADQTNGTVSITTEQDDPESAVLIADAFADQVVRYLAEEQDEIQRERESAAASIMNSLETELAALDRQLLDEIAAQQAEDPDNAQGAEGSAVTRAERDALAVEYSTALQTYRAITAPGSSDLNLTSLERAQPVPQQTGGFSPPRTRATRVPLGAAIGALFGIAIALLAERFDARVRDRRKAEEVFGAAVVGEIPSFNRRQRAGRLVVGPEHHDHAAEAFRSLRTSITFMAAGGQPLANDDHVGVVLVTSPSPAEGKTTTAANLAAAFAETGRSVVVVNADFRRPTITEVLVSGPRPALPAGLAGIERLSPTDFLTQTTVPGVQLLDLSPLRGTPGDLTRATVRLVNDLARLVDVVVIDTPPLAVTTEALEFAPIADVMVLIGRIGRTNTGSAARAAELARFGGTQQLAIALTDTGSTGLRRNHYYGYYGDARRRTRDQPKAAPDRNRRRCGDRSEGRVARGRRPGSANTSGERQLARGRDSVTA